MRPILSRHWTLDPCVLRAGLLRGPIFYYGLAKSTQNIPLYTLHIIRYICFHSNSKCLRQHIIIILQFTVTMRKKNRRNKSKPTEQSQSSMASGMRACAEQFRSEGDTQAYTQMALMDNLSLQEQKDTIRKALLEMGTAVMTMMPI